jgi:hypothetical protein
VLRGALGSAPAPTRSCSQEHRRVVPTSTGSCFRQAVPVFPAGIPRARRSTRRDRASPRRCCIERGHVLPRTTSRCATEHGCVPGRAAVDARPLTGSCFQDHARRVHRSRTRARPGTGACSSEHRRATTATLDDAPRITRTRSSRHPDELLRSRRGAAWITTIERLRGAAVTPGPLSSVPSITFETQKNPYFTGIVTRVNPRNPDSWRSGIAALPRARYPGANPAGAALTRRAPACDQDEALRKFLILETRKKILIPLARAPGWFISN